jgi:two-component system sensor histidine kinase UhpB
VQEGVINALRHGRPSRVSVEVASDGQRIVVTVSDDGVGLPADWARPGHFGLRGLTDRVTQLGGAFQVANQDQGGARLSAQIPLAVPA